MHENDKHIHIETEPTVTPVVTTTPVVDPMVAPATPVVVDTEHRHPQSPMLYVAMLVFAVFGIWGVMMLNSDNTEMANTEVERSQVGYVEQDLAPQAAPFVADAPRRATTDRMAEDHARDMSRDMTEQQVAMDAERIDETTARPEPYDNEVASVNLMEEPGQTVTAQTTAPATTAPSTLPDQTATRPAPPRDAGMVDATPEIAVVDLDYSNRPTVPLSDQDLTNQVGKLEADLDKAEIMAKETGQIAAHEVLEERFDLLEDLMEAKTLPMSEVDRTSLTRQLAELRDELAAFQADLDGLVAGRR